MSYKRAYFPAVKLVLAVALLSGCGEPPASVRQPQEKRPSLGPTAALEQMVAAYRNAASYCDRGVLRLSYREAGRHLHDKSPMSIRAQGRKRLELRAYHATVICDGETFFAQIKDEATQDIDGQVLVTDAPPEFDLRFLYRDSLLRDALTSGLGRQPVQVELLYGARPLEAVFAPDVPKKLLAPQEFDGHMCLRVQVTTDEGDYVFWVDRDEFLLRRLEYPVASLLPQMAQDGKVDDATLIAEFTAARLNHGLPADSFGIEIPATAKQVRYFVLPPQPLPTELFGQRPGPFAFASPNDGSVDSNDLFGFRTVLVWFQDHPACRACLERMQSVYHRYRDRTDTRFYAVCTEPVARSNDSLRGLMEEWQVTVPWVRDLQAVGRDVFHVPWAPTMVVLDGRGTIQAFEVGANPELEQQLPLLLDQLLSGEDVAANTLATHEQSKLTYLRMLESAQNADVVPSHNVSTTVSPASTPRRLRLVPQWQSSEAKAPGNLLAISTDATNTRFLALDGRRSLVEFDTRGRLLGRHALEVDDDGVTFIRTALDGQGNRCFVGASIDGQKLFVFDCDFRCLGMYPPDEEPRGAVADALLMDLDGDGQLELIAGFAQLSGVHCATLGGTRKWESRQMPDVLSLVGTDRLLVSGRRGDVIPFDHAGRPGAAIVVNGRAIFHLHAAEYSPQTTQYCGLTFGDAGNLVAIGLDRDFREMWDYELPAGVYRAPIRFVVSGAWLHADQGSWVLAGPDGTIHVLKEDGAVVDVFGTGRHITGIEVVREAGSAWLVVASPETIQAWRVEERADRLSAAPTTDRPAER